MLIALCAVGEASITAPTSCQITQRHGCTANLFRILLRISHRNSTIDPGRAWPFTKDQFSGIQCQIGVHICRTPTASYGLRPTDSAQRSAFQSARQVQTTHQKLAFDMEARVSLAMGFWLAASISSQVNFQATCTSDTGNTTWTSATGDARKIT